MNIAHTLGLVPEEDYASFAGLSLATLKRHRTERIGPAPVTVGTRRYFRITDIEAALSATPVAGGKLFD